MMLLQSCVPGTVCVNFVCPFYSVIFQVLINIES